MPAITANSNVTWANGTAAVTVARSADSQLARVRAQAQAASDGTPSAIVTLGSDLLVLSGAELKTASRVARSPGGLSAGQTVNVGGQQGTVLLTDDGFREIDASKILVAIIDTGVNVNHPALRGRTVTGFNSATGGTDVTDSVGHGTHVAGIIAGSWDVDNGAAGVASTAKILPIKAADAAGNFSDASIAAGIRHAISRGARVINLSLQGADPLPMTGAAIAEARRAGVLVVAASGNQGTNKVNYPANYEGVLVVGSSVNGVRSSFSNGGSRLDVTAPGDNVRSTEGNAYGTRSGTSMSSPYVAGAAALVMARNPAFSAEQVKAQIINSATDFGARGKDVDFGYGEIDLFKAVYGAGTTPTEVAQPTFWNRVRGLIGGFAPTSSAAWQVNLFAA